MKQWYTRLAEVPDVGYGGSSVDRMQLPGYNAKPKVQRSSWSDDPDDILMWATADGETSASPASQWQSDPLPGETPAQTILRRCLEALELPGTLSNYHFILQGCHQQLWNHRRAEPWTVAEVERLCWLDLRLIQAYPKTVFKDFSGRDEEQGYVHIMAFYQLISLYEKEGYLREALEVARIAVRFKQGDHDLERLQHKLEQLEAEDAA
jgi:hypothetical protein